VGTMGTEDTIRRAKVASDAYRRRFLADRQMAWAVNDSRRDHVTDLLLGGTYEQHGPESAKHPLAVTLRQLDRFVIPTRIGEIAEAVQGNRLRGRISRRDHKTA
jgi:hypothetical protein